MKVITKVKHKARKFDKESKEASWGWKSVLADIRADIEKLESYVLIVERKIENHEPWPGAQSSGQTSESYHSV